MSKKNISEAASEKPNRGRPPVMPKEWQSQLKGLFPDLTTRGLQDRNYAIQAFKSLGGAKVAFKKYPRLFPDADTWRFSLLAELGRLEDPDTIREYAKSLNESTLSVKAAIRRIRAARTGKKPKPDDLVLANRLINVVNQYILETDCDLQTVLSAVETCRQKSIESMEE